MINVKHMIDSSENYIWVPVFVHPQTVFLSRTCGNDIKICVWVPLFVHPQTIFQCKRHERCIRKLHLGATIRAPTNRFFNLEHIAMTYKSVFECHYSCTIQQQMWTKCGQNVEKTVVENVCKKCSQKCCKCRQYGEQTMSAKMHLEAKSRR